MNIKIKILIILTISFIFSDTIYVPGDFETIQEAVDSAIHLDSIFVNSGEYFECIDIEEKSISIFGNSEQNPIIYCEEEYEFAFQMMNFYQQYSVFISEFILSGNCIGGALKFNDTDLELNNIECENFKYTAIYLTNSQLNAENIIIQNPGENAEVYLHLTNSNVIIIGGEFRNLVSNELNSKVFYSIGSNVHISNLLIHDNHSFDDGIFRIFSSNFIGSNLSFVNNQLEFGQGGGIYSFQSELEIMNSNFVNNSAPMGGAISSSVSNLKIFNSNFYNNSANYGGAISHSSDSLTIINSIFNRNISETGGALATHNSTVKMNKSLCSENIANLAGGCMKLTNGSLILIFSNIIKNESIFRESISTNNTHSIILNTVFEKYDYLYDNFQLYDNSNVFISNSVFDTSDLQNLEDGVLIESQNNFFTEDLENPLFVDSSQYQPHSESILIDNATFNFSFESGFEIQLDSTLYWGIAPDIGMVEYIPNGQIGDVNSDSIIDIMDIILLFEFIYNNDENIEIHFDIFQDGEINILDIILLTEIIISNS